MNNYESYADVLESYMIAEEGILSKVAGAAKFIFKHFIEIIRNLKKALLWFLRLHPTIRYATDSMDISKTKKFFKNVIPYIDKVRMEIPKYIQHIQTVAKKNLTEEDYDGYENANKVNDIKIHLNNMYNQYKNTRLMFTEEFQKMCKTAASQLVQTLTYFENGLTKMTGEYEKNIGSEGNDKIKHAFTIMRSDLADIFIPVTKLSVNLLLLVAPDNAKKE